MHYNSANKYLGRLTQVRQQLEEMQEGFEFNPAHEEYAEVYKRLEAVLTAMGQVKTAILEMGYER